MAMVTECFVGCYAGTAGELFSTGFFWEAVLEWNSRTEGSGHELRGRVRVRVRVTIVWKTSAMPMLHGLPYCACPRSKCPHRTG